MITKDLLVYMTHLCNYRCKYCCGVQDMYNGTMKIDYRNALINIDKMLRYICSSDYQTIYLSGGEPTLHPKLYHVCKVLRMHNKHVYVITNLSKDIDYYNKLCDLDVHIIASFHVQNTLFINKVKNINNITHLFVMGNVDHFSAVYKTYLSLKHIHNSVFFIKLDNQTYTTEQEYYFSLDCSKLPINLSFNNINVLTSSGNIYENDDKYENGTMPNDHSYNILEKI